MKSIIVSVDIPSDIFLSLNLSEKDIKTELHAALALRLFSQSKLTLGKAIQLSSVSRYEFEKILSDHSVPVSEISLEKIKEDLDKLKDL